MFLKEESTGETHPLTQNVFTLGSGAINNIVIGGENIRKLHVQLIRKDKEFHLNSINGTAEVNGSQVNEHKLCDGDLIRLGKHSFRFVNNPKLTECPPENDGATNFNPVQAYATLLNRVISLLENPNRENDAANILGLGMELMRADGGYLFETQDKEQRLLHAIPQDNPLYSNSAVEAAFNRKEAIIWSTTESSEDFSLKSIVKKKISSILVAPLLHNGIINGLLYLHRRETLNPFLEEERKLFVDISKLLGVVLQRNTAHFDQEERLQNLQDIKEQGALVYGSVQMAQVVELAQRIAQNDVPVLITGETGTGKEVLAKFVHHNSRRQNSPFIAVNCGAIPESLIESELFGHEKGAFTGASDKKNGLFELANGGTLFLDEIGELPLLMQVKFLRVLQEGKLRRVGGQDEIAVDVRIVAATNRNLENEISKGKFREDLYYRLNLIHLHLPALREREGDVLLLAKHILRKASAKFNMNAAQLSKAGEKALLRYLWPGNIRELENKLQRAMLNSTSRVIDENDLGLKANSEFPQSTLKAAREDAEKNAITQALSKAKGNLTLAASFLGIDRKVLRDVMERIGIAKDTFKA